MRNDTVDPLELRRAIEIGAKRGAIPPGPARRFLAGLEVGRPRSLEEVAGELRVDVSVLGALLGRPKPGPEAPPIGDDDDVGDTRSLPAGFAAAAQGFRKARQGSTVPVPSTPPEVPETPVPEEAHPEEPPERLGRHVDLELLGRGGMGEVYRGYDPELRRHAAIKVARSSGARASRCVERLVVEARVTGQLEHPNIVPVHELDEAADGRRYFSMKLVEGRSLAQLLADLRDRRGRSGRRRRAPADGSAYPLARRLGDFLKICDAIAFAHSRGVLHRDLKPANVMVGKFGEVLVMDWGLARIGEGANEGDAPVDSGRDDEPGDPVRTRDGEVMGTLAYMPPEQASGDLAQLDARSDVYALGATLYELLTLVPPFEFGGPVAQARFRVVMGEFLPPRQRAPERNVPRELESIVMKAMALERADRYGSAEELKADVEAYLDGRAIGAARYGPVQLAIKWARRHRAATAAAALVAATAASLLLGFRWKVEAGRRAEIARAVAEAEQAIESSPAAGDLAGPDGSLPTGQEAQLERSLAARLAAVAALDRGLRLAPGDPVLLARRRDAGRELGELALLGRDYSLARQSFLSLRDQGLEPEEVEALAGRVDRARGEVLARRRERLEAILEDLALGLERPARPRGQPSLEDYVFEAVGYRDPQTVEILGEALSGLARDRLEDATWTIPERDVATFASRVLGRLGLAEAVEPFAGWLRAVRDPKLVVEAGLALCHTARVEAVPVLLELRQRLGPYSPTWQQIAQAVDRVPGFAEGEASSGEGWIEQARRHRDQGALAEALAAYDRAIETEPGNAIAVLERGRLHADAGRADEALRDAARCEELGGWPAAIHQLRGSALFGLGRFEEARREYDQALAVEPRWVLALAGKGYALVQLREYEAALECFELAASEAPEEFKNFHNLAVVLRLMGRRQDALAAADRAVALAPRSPDTLNTRGVLRLELGDVAGARADFETLLAIDPRQPDTLVNLACLLEGAGDLAGALEYIDAAIALAPGDAMAWRQRGVVRRARGDLRGALADLDRAIEIDPGEVQAWWYRGSCCRDLGDFEGMRRAFGRVVEHETAMGARAVLPRLAQALVELASACDRLGRVDEAVAAYRRALEVEPDRKDRDDLEAHLRRLGG